VIPPRLQLDFAGHARSGGTLGAILLLVGALGLTVVILQVHALRTERQGLELHLAARERGAGRARSEAVDAAVQAARPTLVQLATPWTRLLMELERIGKDQAGDVAVLTVEPDPAKHRIKLAAESRDLARALAFVERLRSTHILRNPMLDSHELKHDDPQHPVHFELSAEWSDPT